MQRLGAVFIAICIVAISVSVGAISHFKFGLTIPEASPIAFGILVTLLIIHYQISRVRDRVILDEQMDDITRLKLTLTKEVQDVRELARDLNDTLSERLEKEVEPVLGEMEILGTIVKQLAESCAELDERMDKGDERVEAVNAKLKSATTSVKELGDLLRANMRANGGRLVRENTPQPPQASAQESRPFPDGAGLTPQAEQKRDESPSMPSAASREGDREPVITEADEAAVRRALALGQIEMFMQPVVTLPMRKPQFYEALTRLKTDGDQVITPDIFLPVCRKNSFMPMLDRLAINETFRLQRRLADRGRPVDCFCNLSLQSLADSDFFDLMRELFDQNQDLAEHVILEFSQADMRNFGIMEDETLRLLNSMGFRFSVDHLTDLGANFDQLASKGVRYAKIAKPVLTHRDAGQGMDIHPADFSRVLARKGIDLIVTHVENESDLVSLIDFNIHFAQGNHFAPARALKPTSGIERTAGPREDSPQDLRSGRDGRFASPAQTRTVAAPARTQMTGQQGAVNRGGSPSGSLASTQAGTNLRQEQANPAGGSNRTLGENPKIARALRAMAAEDSNPDASRDQFRTALAEAAGLIEPAGSRPSAARNGAERRSLPSSAAAPASRTVADRLPASDDFGLKTGTDRGQFVELGTGTRGAVSTDPQTEAAPRQPTFERLIR
ncbi:EAL domain-containing protein [uncultured Cohaesibacter sp.]|uniref:EAL domain-containing protein n=1 Tax=uncultured Cohaesibacter sp. TaxID=1002546 RepID=UPI00292EA3D6|nr:EAL domain-containing protein [uncultured Cohaesibacter sp.]